MNGGNENEHLRYYSSKTRWDRPVHDRFSGSGSFSSQYGARLYVDEGADLSLWGVLVGDFDGSDELCCLEFSVLLCGFCVVPFEAVVEWVVWVFCVLDDELGGECSVGVVDVLEDVLGCHCLVPIS